MSALHMQRTGKVVPTKAKKMTAVVKGCTSVIVQESGGET